jgi:hypothetical protein
MTVKRPNDFPKKKQIQKIKTANKLPGQLTLNSFNFTPRPQTNADQPMTMVTPPANQDPVINAPKILNINRIIPQNGESEELPSAILKLIKESVTSYAKLFCSKNKILNETEIINNYQNDPTNTKFPAHLKNALDKITKSNLNIEDKTAETTRIINASKNTRVLRLTSIENTLINYKAEIWNSKILPILVFSELAFSRESFLKLFNNLLKETLAEFFINQKKNEESKEKKAQKFELAKEDKLTVIDLQKGDLLKLTNKINALNIQISTLKKMQSLKAKGGEISKTKKSTSDSSRKNGNKKNIVKNKK